MKTPDEIKQGIKYLTIKDITEKLEAWHAGLAYYYAEDAAADALAYIQQLESQAPKWISVEERLPEQYATVIIWRDDCKNASIGWLISGYWSVPKGVRVTHWMPLPEPPEADDNADQSR